MLCIYTFPRNRETINYTAIPTHCFVLDVVVKVQFLLPFNHMRGGCHMRVGCHITNHCPTSRRLDSFSLSFFSFSLIICSSHLPFPDRSSNSYCASTWSLVFPFVYRRLQFPKLSINVSSIILCKCCPPQPAPNFLPFQVFLYPNIIS